MVNIVSVEGDAVIDNTVKVSAAGGTGFIHKCQLPNLKASWR